MGFDCIASPSFLPVSWFLLYVINWRRSLQSFLSLVVLRILVILVCS